MSFTNACVMEWTVKQILKDSECCGNPWKCGHDLVNGTTVFKACKYDEEDVEVE